MGSVAKVRTVTEEIRVGSEALESLLKLMEEHRCYGGSYRRSTQTAGRRRWGCAKEGGSGAVGGMSVLAHL